MWNVGGMAIFGMGGGSAIFNNIFYMNRHIHVSRTHSNVRFISTSYTDLFLNHLMDFLSESMNVIEYSAAQFFLRNVSECLMFIASRKWESRNQETDTTAIVLAVNINAADIIVFQFQMWPGIVWWNLYMETHLKFYWLSNKCKVCPAAAWNTPNNIVQFINLLL